MTRRSGLGKGLSSLIPQAEALAGGADGQFGDRPVLAEIPTADVVPNPHQPRVHFDEDTLGELAASIAQLGVLQPVLVRLVDGQLPADRRRAALAGGPARRAGDRPGRHPHVRRRQRRRAGAGREPAPPGPHAAGGGGGVPAADRGLRADPRRRRPARRQEPLGGHQHAAPARPAAGRPAPPRRRQAVRRARPGAARHPGPGPAGAPGPGRRRRGVVGADGRGGGAQRGSGAAPAPAPRAAAPGPIDGAGLTDGHAAAPARAARAGAAARRRPRHAGRGPDGRQAGQGDDRLRRPRGPRADLPADRRRER